MSDSPTLGATNPYRLRVPSRAQPFSPIDPKDLHLYILAFWTSLPPLKDQTILPQYGKTSSASTTEPKNQPNHYTEEELEAFYEAFVFHCDKHDAGKSSRTALAFKETANGSGRCHPWLVKALSGKDEPSYAAYAWFETLAIAALEVEEFAGGKGEGVQERMNRAKEEVEKVVQGQKRFIDIAFGHASGHAILKS